MNKAKDINKAGNRLEELRKTDNTVENQPEEMNEAGKVESKAEDMKKAENIVENRTEDLNKLKNMNDPNFKSNNGKLPFFKEKNAFPVYIAQNKAIFVDKESGEILGPIGEGTLGIILYGGDPTMGFDPESGRLNVECAIKIPRLLYSNSFLNFNIAEIANYEGIQAIKFSGKELLLGADSFFRLDNANVFTRIPTSGAGNCYIGFYLASNSRYKICLVSKDECWPKEFKECAENQDLFEKIKKRCDNGTDQFDNLLFFRDEITDTRRSDDKLQIFSREGIYRTFRQKNINGWWFNLPIAIYPWMSCDLERILTAYVDEGLNENTETDQKAVADLKRWELSEWFRLFLNLCNGILNLHDEGCIHGDPRPANIMTRLSIKMKLLASSFRWIDIALGYDVGSFMTAINAPESMDNKNTTIVPRPLGGGRTTPFYAPERTEGLEYEDADLIKLEIINNEQFRLKFFYKQNTFFEPRILHLKRNGAALCELGTLNKNDRIQVKEYIFVVEEVGDTEIIVSHIFELALDRLLIDVSFDKKSRDNIVGILSNTSIPRYRVFRQWSEATDIYGLGVTILYILYMIGLSEIKIEEKPDHPNAMFTHRQAIFIELIALLRNKSFLKNTLHIISRKGYKNFESLCTQGVLLAQYTDDYTLEASNPTDTGKIIEVYKTMEAGNITDDNKTTEADTTEANNIVEAGKTTNTTETSKSPSKKAENDSQRISAITDIILSSDSNLEIILYGLNHNIGLFVQILYFVLSCLWRKEDFNSEPIVENHEFTPFCVDKIRIKDSNKRKEPANAAYNAMNKIQSGVAPLSLKTKKYSDSGQLNLLLFGRIDQSIALTQKNNDLTQRIEILNDEKDALDREIRDLNGRNGILNRDKSALSQEISGYKDELAGLNHEVSVCKELLANIQNEIINGQKTKLLFFDKAKINEEISKVLEAGKGK
jgi:serine/threonine protein kinase